MSGLFLTSYLFQNMTVQGISGTGALRLGSAFFVSNLLVFDIVLDLKFEFKVKTSYC